MPRVGVLREVMTPREVLAAIRAGLYAVDADTGSVTNRRGKPVAFVVKPSGRRFVRLYVRGKVKAIAVARLVWMSVAGRTIPKGFEIHHRDEDNSNDAWNNLICLHALDHLKVHAATDDEVPF
jgi:hypothetical protein